jgi:hypothetical protein
MQSQDMEWQAATGTFALTGKLVDDAIGGIPTTQWLERPAPESNHVLWIIGHLAATRSLVLHALGDRRDPMKLDPLFAGGIPLQEDAAYPPPAVVIDAWREMSIRVDRVLQAASPAELQRPSPEGVPTFNGLVSGALAACVFHESYHVGQLGYLTRWLGHGPLLGR